MNEENPPKVRRNSLSHERKRVEEYLTSLPGSTTATRIQIAKKLGFSESKASEILNVLRVSGFAKNKAAARNVPGLWCCSDRKDESTEQAKPPGAPWVSGQQPNGSSEYWAKHHFAAMGTPRL